MIDNSLIDGILNIGALVLLWIRVFAVIFDAVFLLIGYTYTRPLRKYTSVTWAWAMIENGFWLAVMYHVLKLASLI